MNEGRVTTDAFFAVDEDWTITYVSRKAESILSAPVAGVAEGDSANETVEPDDCGGEDPMDGTDSGIDGTCLWDVLPAGDPSFGEQLSEAFETREPRAFEAYFEPLDAWLEVRAYPATTGLSIHVREVTERRERNVTPADRKRVLGEVYEVSADTELSFETQVSKLLEIGRDALDIGYGVLSRIDGDEYVFEVVATDDEEIRAGDVVPAGTTNCERVVATEGTVVLANVGESNSEGEGLEANSEGEGLEANSESDEPEPNSEGEGLEAKGDDSDGTQVVSGRDNVRERHVACYLGAPVIVDDEVYGTFCFYDHDPRHAGFSDWEVTLVDLMAQWVSYELTHERTRQRLQRKNAQLERQNRQLEEFVSIVSHDLRNPLTILDGWLEQAERSGDPDHFQRCYDAVDRMETLIEELLTLARAGEQITETESVDLEALVRQSWDGVETKDASLTVENAGRLRADRSRLQQLLKNLVRNAVQHGGEDVHVTVEGIDGGFAVEDDGPGIPASDREEVFDAGFSTAETGTGFGLNIVEQIADGHGWSVTVTDSERGGGGAGSEGGGEDGGESGGKNGGARFEFRDVESV
jgi:signal transduction histidine kinase